MDIHVPQDSSTPNEPAPGTPEAYTQLNARFRKLESLFIFTVAALILMSFGINIYLAKQMRAAQGALSVQRPEVKRFSEGFRTMDEPVIRNFVNALQRYARTNQDFQPILERYRQPLNNYMLPVGAMPSAAPPPVTNPPRK